MEYRTGRIGRIFAARFDHDEDFLAGLRALVLKEQVRSGWFQILGGLGRAGVVTGPREPTMPPDPVWRELDETREVLGSGSVHWENGEPRIHLHAALGHHNDCLTVCVRRNTKVYLTLEVLLFELEGIDASRPWDEACGFYRLQFS
jgi:hypothetical protein